MCVCASVKCIVLVNTRYMYNVHYALYNLLLQLARSDASSRQSPALTRTTPKPRHNLIDLAGPAKATRDQLSTSHMPGPLSSDLLLTNQMSRPPPPRVSKDAVTSRKAPKTEMSQPIKVWEAHHEIKSADRKFSKTAPAPSSQDDDLGLLV